MQDRVQGQGTGAFFNQESTEALENFVGRCFDGWNGMRFKSGCNRPVVISICRHARTVGVSVPAPARTLTLPLHPLFLVAN